MATGYSSSYSKSPGDTIGTTEFSTEFTNIQAAMNATTGHNHDGTAGGGAPIPLGGNAVTGQLPLSKGGTGANLVDPNADRILFWDDSAGSTAFLTASTGLTISGTSLTVSAPLASIAGLTTAADRYIYTTASDTYAVGTITSFARTILDDTDAATVRTTIGAQASDATLTALAGVSTSADQVIYATGSDTFTTTSLTAFGRSLIDDANAATARGTLGLATSTTDNAIVRFDSTSGATQNSGVTISDSNEIENFRQAAATTQTLTDGANIDWNMASGAAATVTLGGNRTMNAPTNLKAGATYVLVINQDGTGSRTLTWNSVFKWPGGVAPTLSTAASAKDIVSFYSDGTNLYGVLNQGFA